MDGATHRNGLVPYLFYDDVVPMLEWYSRVFGWQELQRWEEDGKVANAEMAIGDTELWLDGGVGRSRMPESPWVGVWVDDPDAMYEQVRAAGVAADPPEDKPYGVRMLTVTDPVGYQWGFMRRIG
jgi:PhnB protein